MYDVRGTFVYFGDVTLFTNFTGNDIVDKDVFSITAAYIVLFITYSVSINYDVVACFVAGI